jgi:hypothetical protein
VEFSWTRHGKGPHDGVGAVLKRFLKKSQLGLNGPKLQNAKDVVTLMRIHLSSRPKTSYTKGKKHVTCVFWHVNITNVDHQTSYTCDYMKGSYDVNKMLKKDLSCFCCFCFDYNYKNCVNLAWT